MDCCKARGEWDGMEWSGMMDRTRQDRTMRGVDGRSKVSLLKYYY